MIQPVRGGWVLAILMAAASLSACGGMGGSSSVSPFGKTYRVGIAPWMLDKSHGKNTEAFLEALASAGYRADANLEVKIVDAAGNAATHSGVIRDLKNWPADLIYVLTAEGARIAQEESPDISTVFSDVAYPLEHGLVERLEFSANRSVGVKTYVPIEEQMALIQRLVPREINKIAVCLRSKTTDAQILLEEMRAALQQVGTAVWPLEATSAAGMAQLLENREMSSSVDLFYLSCDALMQGPGADVVIEHAARRNIPILSCGMMAVEKGALAGVVIDPEVAGRMAGQQAAQILGGRTPTSLQSLAAGPPRVVINKTAARLLGVRIPETFLGEEVHVYE